MNYNFYSCSLIINTFNNCTVKEIYSQKTKICVDFRGNGMQNRSLLCVVRVDRVVGKSKQSRTLQ